MDEDDEKDEILKGLSGEVDDYAGKQMEDPNAKTQGVTIEISVKPHGADAPESKEEEATPPMEADSEDHDPIAHILGMCCGGEA